MALADRWLLPDGVKEMLPPNARQVEVLRRKMLDLYDSWGYDLVMPPLMEHFDSLLTGVGKDLELNTFKLVDQLTGQTLGIRADITPQVARIDAHRMHVEGANRLCYCGSVLHTHSANMLASRNPLQVGAELYGHAGIESDIEVISLMLETLYASGLQDELSLDLGHVGIFQGVVVEADLDASVVTQYMELLQRKALPELSEFLGSLDIDASYITMLAELPKLNGGLEVLAKAKDIFAGTNASILEAIAYLERLSGIIQQRYPAVDLYFDLGELRGYNYHTGVVFSALTPVFGQAVAKGGRYDAIGKDFGRARPATGFSADLKTLADLAAGVDDNIVKGILAPEGGDTRLMQKIADLRSQGIRVMQQLPGDTATDAAVFSQKLVKQGEEWVLAAL
ncbi:ATP phosphoribosyltransferase regulatory subunit [Neptunomonas japonica]|uniref:ATP phosphoribosyltransferase regulatory subunit n=1 Tax=Neptunomonas japonica JAMM 1380 TaxID=1441457 RepID=A0A7R6PQY5_9GAMM|nr:ATP phosphoribosyltransferase regulatory subunit [Neptunomonas japonica]BBB30987.1 ATP phosphoribosyltransferase regulatory subunit [Neptunomonas japonica JAMM 1380]